MHIYKPLRKVNFFKRNLTGLNWKVFLLQAEEPSPFIGLILFLCEMQLAWSRIWTRVAVSISYDDNHYTKGTA